MKRIYLLVFFLSSILYSNAQALLTEGFEGSFPPAGWTILKTGNGNNWTSNTDASLALGPYGTHSGSGSMVYEYSASTAANAWAITPSVSLTAGTSYSISFAYRVRSSSYPERLKVTVGSAATIAAQTTVLWNNNGSTQLTNTGWRVGVIKFTPQTTGTFYFGFNCYSLSDEFALLVDDVTVEVTPASVPACSANITPAASATNVNNPITFSWNPVQGATSYDFYIGTTSTPPLNNNFDTTSVTLTGGYNTTYYWYVVPKNGAGSATGCASSVSSFTTGAPPVPPPCANILTPANFSTNVTTSPTFSWNPSPGATAYTFYLGLSDPPDSLGVTTDTAVSLTQPLDPSTTYYWAVVATNAGGSASDCSVYSFTTRAAASVPPNDDACSAIALTVNGAADCENTESATTADSDTTLECSVANNTVWYKYTPATSGPVTIKMKRTVNAGLNLNAWVALFTATGDCPELTFTQAFPCDNADLVTNDSVTIISQNLTAGTTYYIMVDGVGGAIGEFCINLLPPPPPPACAMLKAPSNFATNVDVAPVFSWSSVTSATGYAFYIGVTPTPDSLGVTTDTTVTLSQPLIYNTTYYWSVVPENPAGSATGCDVYSFTTGVAPAVPACATLLTPANGSTNVNAPSTSFSWSSVPDATSYAFYIGTTNPPDSLGTTTDTAAVVSGQEFGTTYYWSVVPMNGGGPATGCAVDSFTTMDAPAMPVNDECTGAIALTSYSPLSGSTLSATQSLAADSCGGFAGDANDDVWFKFTTVQAGSASITLTPDLDFDGVLVAYRGICGQLVKIDCADAGIEGDAETLTLTGLAGNTTYYFRVYGYGHRLTEGTFTLTASGVSLPINLVNFKGVRSGSKNILSWSTEREQNNKGFELQRSVDGRNFSTIVFVPSMAANGNSASKLNYGYTDEKPFSGNAYYRLNQVDIDGKSTLSDVVLLKGSKNNTLVLSNVYPNPARTELNVVIGAPANDKVSLVVTDIAGKILMTKAIQVITGDNNFSLNVSRLPSGSYMIKAVCANGCETAVNKFVKQ